ncbi:hypothetical protein [Beihai Nido-like virus 2]|uniref:Uncharacterized protein n=1 Tax=Beihai Nido-like virus 2 TaxID=1922351 RepID=A0A1L3KIQ2_9NIDO|nr:hypothetical protein [Beihai Nido-like virus 2]APG77318.1 hypothetical protein [Beihai Nido-like virus 2]
MTSSRKYERPAPELVTKVVLTEKRVLYSRDTLVLNPISLHYQALQNILFHLTSFVKNPTASQGLIRGIVLEDINPDGFTWCANPCFSDICWVHIAPRGVKPLPDTAHNLLHNLGGMYREKIYQFAPWLADQFTTRSIKDVYKPKTELLLYDNHHFQRHVGLVQGSKHPVVNESLLYSPDRITIFTGRQLVNVNKVQIKHDPEFVAKEVKLIKDTYTLTNVQSQCYAQLVHYARTECPDLNLALQATEEAEKSRRPQIKHAAPVQQIILNPKEESQA